MAAEIEEVLVEADGLDLEELAPDRRDATLRLRAGDAVPVLWRLAGPVGQPRRAAGSPSSSRPREASGAAAIAASRASVSASIAAAVASSARSRWKSNRSPSDRPGLTLSVTGKFVSSGAETISIATGPSWRAPSPTT